MHDDLATEPSEPPALLPEEQCARLHTEGLRALARRAPSDLLAVTFRAVTATYFSAVPSRTSAAHSKRQVALAYALERRTRAISDGVAARALAEREAGWRAWLAEAACNGAGRLHQFSKSSPKYVIGEVAEFQ